MKDLPDTLGNSLFGSYVKLCCVRCKFTQMLFMKILIFILIVIIAVACEKNSIVEQKQVRYVSVKDFKINKDLHGVKIALDSMPLGSIAATKIDSLLLFQFDWRVVDYHIALYNANTGKFIQQLLPVGRGVGESTSLVHYCQSEKKDYSSSSIWVETDNQFSLLNMQKSIQAKQAVYDAQYDFNRRLDLFHKFIVHDSILVGKVYKNKRVPYYILYNINQEKIIDTMSVFLPMQRLVEENMFASYDQIKPDQSKLAMVMNYFNIVNILSIDNKNILSLVMADSPLSYDKAWKLQFSRETACVYYDGLCVSDKYIYCIYKNCLRVNRKKQPQTKILIFDWNGNPQLKLNLSENISNISFDAKENCLYGMSRYGEESVFRYDLKNVLN